MSIECSNKLLHAILSINHDVFTVLLKAELVFYNDQLNPRLKVEVHHKPSSVNSSTIQTLNICTLKYQLINRKYD
jgi:hypothetical protein